MDDFHQLCLDNHPVTGERLTVRDHGPKRRICFFGQISPPKDASIAYLIGEDERILDWWKEAVSETVKEIEAATATRIRKGGVDDQDRYTGGRVAAVVTHEASRALDPQLHTHICVMNVTYDHVEQQWKAVQPENFYKYQSFFREVCYNKLAERMTEAGYGIEKARKIGFHLKGFPEALRMQFSKRSVNFQFLEFDHAADKYELEEAALNAVTESQRAKIFKCLRAAYGGSVQLYIRMWHARPCDPVDEEEDDDRDGDEFEVNKPSSEALSYVMKGFREG